MANNDDKSLSDFINQIPPQTNDDMVKGNALPPYDGAPPPPPPASKE